MNKPLKRSPASLYVADDDSVIRELVQYYAARASIAIEVFENGDELLANLHEEVQVCLLDLDMPGASGIQCLEDIKKRFPQTEVIILTACDQAGHAIEAIRKGAFDYVTKPFDPEELINCIRNAKLIYSKNQENLELRASVSEKSSDLGMLGQSAEMKALLQFVNKVADTPNPVLITGESGTGKTLLARKIHQQSHRTDGPFVCVSCPSIPRDLMESEMFGHEKGAFSGAIRRKLGKAELANGGTLFLDEVGDLSAKLQVKLLNYLQDKTFYRVGGEQSIQSNARIIAATNQNLQELVEQGLFREDLYFRLNVLPVEIPPLRHRLKDLQDLFKNFLQKTALTTDQKIPEVDPEVMSILQSHPWPGNIRELENAVTRAYTMRQNPSRLNPEDFHFLIPEKQLLIPGTQAERNTEHAAFDSTFLIGKTLHEIEKLVVEKTIDHCSGNKAKAAKMLGIAEKSIYNKLNRFQNIP